MASYLAEASYGKDKVRVFRVVREGEIHHIVEYNVQVLLEGALDTRQAQFFPIARSFLRERANSYTQADNSVVVATDSIKNITYCEWMCDMRRVIDREEGTDLAKISPHILSAERFGLHLATHFVSKYAHIRKALVTIEQLRWSRVTVDGKPHGHSFVRDGDEKRVAKVEVDGSRGKDQLVGNVSAGINDLLG